LSLEAANLSGAIARKGTGVCKAIDGMGVEMLGKFVHEVVREKVSAAAADEFGGYSTLKPMKHPRQSVDHKAGDR
jgi:hypothetical protein